MTAAVDERRPDSSSARTLPELVVHGRQFFALIVIVVAIAACGAVTYARWRAACTFLTFLSPAPALFVVMSLQPG